ncbi:MAG: glycerol acyltransferase [Cytophagales bacterium]|nr:MAG: glycerol acyltransferase [Cytophagales bacterium]TAF60743.1 MAG: glycerol acyltransferase [Cytophagales bacterium]
MMQLISRFYYKLIGWKVESGLPPNVRRCVMIAAPHTSNYDYPITMAAFYMLGIKVRFLAKKELFSFPLGLIMRATGGLPVNRSKKNNLVEQMAELLNSESDMVMLIPPEGTRSKVESWKSGFYHVAVQAKVPIALGYLDYKTRRAGVGPIIEPSGNLEADMQTIKAFYAQITPKYPSLYA